MLVKLELPFVDARAADLALALDAPHEKAISVLTISGPAHDVELRLLGCSHQAIVTTDDFELSELVACRPGHEGPLPARATEQRQGHRYEFRATTSSFESTEYAARADTLMRRMANLKTSLVGTFPGPDGAFTALSFSNGAGERALVWETWHGYPQTREIVYTASRVTR